MYLFIYFGHEMTNLFRQLFLIITRCAIVYNVIFEDKRCDDILLQVWSHGNFRREVRVVFLCVCSVFIHADDNLTSPLNCRYTMAMMVGESGAGLMVSMTRILTKASYGDSEDGVQHSTYLFLYLSITFIVW